MEIFAAVSFFLAVIITNAANRIPFNGMTAAEVSERYPHLLAMGNVTFAIWDLIYVLLLAFAILVLWSYPMGKERQQELARRSLLWFAGSSVVNLLWVFAWHYQQFGLSLFLILALFGLVASLYQVTRSFPVISWWEKALIHLPFQIYLGWLTIVVLTNLTVLLVAQGLDGSGLEVTVWSGAVLVVAVASGYLVLRLWRDYAFNAVLLWAFLGIVIQRWIVQPRHWIIILAAAAAVLATVFLMVREFLNRPRPGQELP